MNKIFLLPLVFLILFVFPEADSSGEERIALSLSECLETGLANSIDIKIAKIESMIKDQDVLISRSIFDSLLKGKTTYTDDQRASSSSFAGEKTLTADYEVGFEKTLPTGTEIDIDYSNIRTWTDSAYVTQNPVHEAELSFTLKQPLLKNFFGYIDQKTVKLSKIEADLAGLKALDRIENTIADIEKAYWQLVFAYQDVSLREELLKQATELFETFQEHLKTGLVESTELYETEANMRIRKTELLIAQNDLKTASNSLLLLLNEDKDFLVLPKQKLDVLGERADMVQALNEAFIANRDYRMKKKELNAKKIKLKLKENSLWPEVDLVGTLAINGVGRKFEKANRRLTTDKHPKYYGGVEFTIPLENNEARGEYNKASLEKKKAILEVLQAEKDLATNVNEEVRDVNLNLENAKRWGKIRKIQYQKFKEEKKKLQYGRSSSKLVIDYQNDLTLAALSEYKAILQYYMALVDLENEKDTLLEKVGVLKL
ncbi:MAG: TolC family protein [Candidatus Omnitrophica bacterium]|nr:TolC family protein [Candidatus Omnitrophota bacterium]